MIPSEIKEYESIEKLKTKIQDWKPNGCHCKLFQSYTGQVENSKIPEITEIMEKAVKQGNYEFCQ